MTPGQGVDGESDLTPNGCRAGGPTTDTPRQVTAMTRYDDDPGAANDQSAR